MDALIILPRSEFSAGLIVSFLMAWLGICDILYYEVKQGQERHVSTNQLDHDQPPIVPARLHFDCPPATLSGRI